MSKDLRKDSTHPLGWSDDPVVQGKGERDTFGPDKQTGWLNGESYDDYQRRIHGK